MSDWRIATRTDFLIALVYRAASSGTTSLSGFLQAFASDLKDASTVGGVLNTQA
jgi:hypothetical protein